MRSLLLLLACASLTFAAERQPNIILIYSDDHGWADLGAQGVDKDIRTPNLDQLAKDGVRFNRGYVSAPQCVPSRAGVMTGRYQQKFGVEDNGKGPLPLAEVTIAERLKSAGYVTGQVGKWHLDSGGKKGEKAVRLMKEHMPHGQGFDEYFRGELRQFFASHDLQGKPFADAPHLVADSRFRVVVQTEAALSFLDRRTAKPDQPFFLYLAWYAPHVPLESPEPWFSQTPANLPKERRQALSMIAAMDEGLGQLRAKLKAMNQEENTLIFFIGDNGAPLGAVWNGSINVPMVGQKGMLAEGGIRTPFLAAWPSKIPAGMVYDKPVINLDVAATAVALAGLPKDPVLDGTNLLPYLLGKNPDAPHERLFWRWGSQAAVQEFPWKLIRLGDRVQLLFDISQPDGENINRNLFAQQPEVVARLNKALKAWSETLLPPGLPTSFDAHHEDLFAEHDLILRTAPPVKNAEWICRNGTLEKKGDVSKLVADPKATPKARVFLALSGLSLNGAVTFTARTRSAQGGEASVTWRTQEDKDFIPANTVKFVWPAGPDLQEVKVLIPSKGRLIHLRVSPPTTGDATELDWIELQAEGGTPSRTDF